MLPNNTLLQGRYLIVEQIGRGGMGAVYKATDTRLRSTVALKETLVGGEVLLKAFEREAQLLAGLRHPALPRVSDHFIDESGQFLVMEFIPATIWRRCCSSAAARFRSAMCCAGAIRLLDALDYLHSRQPPVVHRDIKPQNMKLTDRGEIILLDFGLAKGAAMQTRVTGTGSIFGYTPHYARSSKFRAPAPIRAAICTRWRPQCTTCSPARRRIDALTRRRQDQRRARSAAGCQRCYPRCSARCGRCAGARDGAERQSALPNCCGNARGPARCGHRPAGAAGQ